MEGGEGCDAMVAIEDGRLAFIHHQHARGFDLSIGPDEVLCAHERLAAVGVLIENGVPVPKQMMLKHRAYRALSAWAEANAVEGKFTPFPSEVSDYMEAKPEE